MLQPLFRTLSATVFAVSLVAAIAIPAIAYWDLETQRHETVRQQAASEAVIAMPAQALVKQLATSGWCDGKADKAIQAGTLKLGCGAAFGKRQ